MCLYPTEVKHAREQLALRERHLSEVSFAFSQLAPTDVVRREEAEEAEREAQAMKEYQESLAAERAERLARIQKEKEDFEAELRRRNEVRWLVAVR